MTGPKPIYMSCCCDRIFGSDVETAQCGGVPWYGGLIACRSANDSCRAVLWGVLEGDQVIPVANRVQEYFDIVIATADWHPPGHGSLPLHIRDARQAMLLSFPACHRFYGLTIVCSILKELNSLLI